MLNENLKARRIRTRNDMIHAYVPGLGTFSDAQSWALPEREPKRDLDLLNLCRFKGCCLADCIEAVKRPLK